MEREVLEFSNEDAKDIAYGDHDDFNVVSDEMIDHRRWSITHEVIVQRISDSKYFKSQYSIGATESQDQFAYDYDDPKFTQVFPIEKTIIVYE